MPPRPKWPKNSTKFSSPTVAAQKIPVATGRFRQHMEVELVNDGPVTLVLECKGESIV